MTNKPVAELVKELRALAERANLIRAKRYREAADRLEALEAALEADNARLRDTLRASSSLHPATSVVMVDRRFVEKEEGR